jgi:hypothetical protein
VNHPSLQSISQPSDHDSRVPSLDDSKAACNELWDSVSNAAASAQQAVATGVNSATRGGKRASLHVQISQLEGKIAEHKVDNSIRRFEYKYKNQWRSRRGGLQWRILEAAVSS